MNSLGSNYFLYFWVVYAFMRMNEIKSVKKSVYVEVEQKKAKDCSRAFNCSFHFFI